jgi:hypothetical protein
MLVACGLVASALVRAQTPAFEVASVKPNPTGSRSSNRWSKGSFEATNMPLRMLIAGAYGMRADRIAGAPSWIDAEGFDVIARSPADTPNEASVAGVLDGSAGRMVVDRTGLTGTYDVDLRFARSNLQTAPAAGVDLPSLFTALQEQLGLKLESTTGPVEFLVIDRIERPTPD